MSLYGLVFGEQQGADAVMALLDLDAGMVGRFRDAWVEADGEGGYRAVIYTRNGGNNREDYMPDFSGHPLYLYDQDDDFDNTYATIYFRLPERPGVQEAVAAAVEEPVDTSARWQAVLKAIEERP